MSLQPVGHVELPAHAGTGGFDHAAIHHRSGRLYVAHTANDALDVIDCRADQYRHSIPGLGGVAGALVTEERNLVFTSNRGENTVGVFSPEDESSIVKIAVGIRPNGLAYDSRRSLLLTANVGDPAVAGSFTLSMVDVARRSLLSDVPVPGRTRWAIFNPQNDSFYVNIADPPCLVVVDAAQPDHVARTFVVPATGPHGLDLDTENNRLFCACDDKKLMRLDAATGEVSGEADLSGAPDVIFYNAALNHLYVAEGDPGVIEVFDTNAMKRIAVAQTETGAHTIAFDQEQNKVYAFLPVTQRAAVYSDCI
jgi:DNA-binding beta-propeller fold protein YncE